MGGVGEGPALRAVVIGVGESMLGLLGLLPDRAGCRVDGDELATCRIADLGTLILWKKGCCWM